MKTFLYVTDMSSNGTRQLLICDEDSQVIASVDEAVFGGQLKFVDSLGGAMGLINSDSVGYFEYCHEAYDCDEYGVEHLLEDSFVNMLLEHGEYQGVVPVIRVSVEWVLEHIAISPVNNGSEVLNVLKKYGSLILNNKNKQGVVK